MFASSFKERSSKSEIGLLEDGFYVVIYV